MEFTELEEWLDKIVAAKKELADLKVFNSQIEMGNADSSVMLFKGIDVVADIIGVQLERRGFTEEIKYHYSFIYEGVEFWHVSNEELGNYAKG